MPWIPMQILLRTFYYGIFKWWKHSSDLLGGGNFIECEETKDLDIINGLSSFFVYDHGVDAIMDKIDIIEKKINTLNFKEGERPTQVGQDILEIEDDWEPFIRISIFDKTSLLIVILDPWLLPCPKLCMTL